jgi:hypothetical protein
LESSKTKFRSYKTIGIKRLYSIVGWAIIVLGVVHMLATFRLFHGLNNAALWFFASGIAIALTGVLNLLHVPTVALLPGCEKFASVRTW